MPKVGSCKWSWTSSDGTKKLQCAKLHLMTKYFLKNSMSLPSEFPLAWKKCHWSCHTSLICMSMMILTSCLLLQGHTQVNFVSTLLRITMSDQLDLPVRQAGKSKLWWKQKFIFRWTFMGEKLSTMCYTDFCIHKVIGKSIICSFIKHFLLSFV